MTAPARLGTTITPVETVEYARGLFCRPRIKTATRTDYLDWTVDGLPVRELFESAKPGSAPVLESTLISPAGSLDEYTRDRLRALLGEVGSDTSDAVFPNGRVGILFCNVCGGLDCPTLSAAIEFDDNTVTWRDIAFQTDGEPLSIADQVGVTITFAREQYEATIRELLARP